MTHPSPSRAQYQKQYRLHNKERIATAKNPEEVEKLCHYSNLQMLTPEDNLKKGDNYGTD